MTRVAVLGAFGRMGSAVCEAVAADADCELVARVGSGGQLEEVIDAGADVAVEFTVPDSVKRNVTWLLERGVHTVVGATGLSEDDLADLEQLTGPANLCVAPNFAIGAVLLMQLAAQAARHLPQAEIIELHHDRKVDAPSGTALRTARLVADARREAPAVPGPADDPARGLLVDGVPVHSVRLPGLVASQEVVFGGPGQTLSIRHDALDRTAFMPGVLLAIRTVATRPGLTVGLDSLL
ncbi:MAG: 4-hydroxy-tetrahydrodipicolinate reductase [Egibacteraceae bacterium]